MKKVTLWSPVILWMCIIFTLSSRERVQVSSEETVNFIVFKASHLFEYALMFMLNYRAFKFTLLGKKQIEWFLIAFIISVCFAGSDEIHQTFVPTRGGMARDVIIDTIGMVFAWIIISQLLPRAPRKLQKLVERFQLV